MSPPQIDKPLIQAIEQVLEAHPDGLNERQVRRAVVEQVGLRRRPADVRQALRGAPDLFVPLSGGVWRLRAAVEAENIATGQEPPPQERGEVVRPFLADLPSLDAYIAFDLETTGFSPDRDQILQIGAVRMLHGAPVPDGAGRPAIFNQYVNPEGRGIPHSLRVKLGFTGHPEWEAQLAEADPLEVVLGRFREWVGDLPLVAHNARFDRGFLQPGAAKLGWKITNPFVDSMELTCLARPDLRTLRLEDVAEALGVGPGREGGRQVERWAEVLGVEGFSWTDFHNAVVDALVLASVVPRLVAALQRRLAASPAFARAFSLLMPTAATALGVSPEPEVDGEPLTAALIFPREVPEERTSRSLSSFRPKMVRARFEQMVAAGGLKRREAQLDMVEAVSRALVEDRYMAIEAPTGTGKTFAYLVPSVLWARSQGEPVVISTYTRVLQDQMDRDLEAVRARLGVPFRSQVLKGFSNYVCPQRVETVFQQTDTDDLDVEERFAWACVLSWLASTEGGELDEVHYWARRTFPMLERLLQSLRAERGECAGESCAAQEICFYRQAYRQACVADLVVTNHALLLTKDWETAGLPLKRVVLDEAHNMEDAATNAATREVSWPTVMYLVDRLLDARSGRGVLIRVRDKVRNPAGQRLIAVALQKRNTLATLTKDFGHRLQRYAALNRAEVHPQYGATLTLPADPRRVTPVSWRPVQEARVRLSRTLHEASEVVGRLRDWLVENPLPAFQKETLNELSYLSRALAEQGRLLEDLLRVGYDSLVRVHWVEVERAMPWQDEQEPYPGPYRWAVKQAPVRVGSHLEEVLYDGARTVVLTSATLRTTREVGFGFLLDRLGLMEQVAAEDALALRPELPYGRALFSVARYMRSDARPSEIENFVDEVARELEWLFRFTSGNGLVLFTARARMLRVFEELEGTLGKHRVPVGCQGRTGSARDLLEEMRARPGMVLLGLKRFWEGVDIPGPNVSYVVMEKLPFPLVGEPMVQARAAEIRARGGHEFMDYILPLMLVDFKQGFGRLIRDEDDIGVVLLLDKRVWNREYYADLLRALPGMDQEDEEKRPQVLDGERQRSRREVYQAIKRHMAGAPAHWQIDEETMKAILDIVPDELLTRLEQLLMELALPAVVPSERLDDLWSQVERGLRQLFDFRNWRVPEQGAAVRTLLTGRDALVILPTGSGKSLAFQLPALLRKGTTLVFSPLKALMKDQVDKLQDRGLALAERVDSSQTAEEQERVFQRMREGTVRLVYVAPERVRDPRLLAALREAENIVQVVVDEAHCVHMWGQSFRPDYLYIRDLLDAIAQVQGRRPAVAAFTATATPRVREAVAQHLGLREGWVEISRNPNRPELRFVVYNQTSPGWRVRSRQDKFRILLQILWMADRQDQSAVVYVNTTRGAEHLARRLEAVGLEARHYHGKMDDQARKEVQDMFSEGQIQIVVATKAFGMGVDKPDIRYVIHYEVPGDLESYFQAAGRAGRDGKVSWCVLLYHPSDLWVHRKYFIPNSLPDPDRMEQVLTWVRGRFERAGWSAIFVDPVEMAEALGLDEDRELGIHLHLLEELGFVERGADVSLRASVRLLVPKRIARQRALEAGLGQAGHAVAQLVDADAIPALARGELRPAEVALSADLEPSVLDEALYRLALRGVLIYRPFARAMSLRTGPKIKTGGHLRLDLREAERVRSELEADLEAMRRYAEDLRVGDCLRKTILNHLGAEKPPTPAGECCSLCDVNLNVPWSDGPNLPDLADPGRYRDAKYEVLKAAAWNARLADGKGRAPYGAWTLAQILMGNDYMATRYQEDPERRRARRRFIVSCPHFGVLEGLRGQSQKVLKLFEELQDEGFVEKRERDLPDGTYEYPVPTGKGWKRLEEGRLFT